MVKRGINNLELKREKKLFGKIWDFLWHSNSILSWIVDLILLFLIIKFILIPLVSLIMATPMPIYIVESCSMYHDSDFDSWWNKYGSWYQTNGISKVEAEKWKFNSGLDKGDMVIIYGRFDLQIGDIIVFDSMDRRYQLPIIHRVVDDDIITTKGDNGKTNPQPAEFERAISPEQIYGKTILRIPKIGWIKLYFVDLFRGKPIIGC